MNPRDVVALQEQQCAVWMTSMGLRQELPHQTSALALQNGGESTVELSEVDHWHRFAALGRGEMCQLAKELLLQRAGS